MEKKYKNNNSCLTFRIGNEEFGIHVSQVLNILEMTKITEIPDTPDYMKGVINLRGTALPVIDLRTRFGMGKSEYTGNTCLIVFELQIKGEKIYLGAIVDEVLSVIEIMKRDVEPPPNIGNSYKSEFIYGMVKSDDKFIMLMDMHQVISENDMDSINQKKQENITE